MWNCIFKKKEEKKPRIRIHLGGIYNSVHTNALFSIFYYSWQNMPVVGKGNKMLYIIDTLNWSLESH